MNFNQTAAQALTQSTYSLEDIIPKFGNLF